MNPGCERSRGLQVVGGLTISNRPGQTVAANPCWMAFSLTARREESKASMLCMPWPHSQPDGGPGANCQVNSFLGGGLGPNFKGLTIQRL